MISRWVNIKNSGKIILMSTIVFTMVIVFSSLFCMVDISYAQEKVYEEVVVDIPEGKEYNAAQLINDALKKAIDDSEKYYKIIILPQKSKEITEYYLNKQIQLYSNTWLFVDDNNGQTPIVFNKCHEYAMVTSENKNYETTGYDGFQNVKIEGGIWNGKTAYENGEYFQNAGFNHFRFAHGKNLELKNLKIINNNNAHHVQVAGIDGFYVSGCTFEGYNRMTESHKEAIQIDILSSETVFGSANKYDDTPMINVDIHDNKFRNVDRGVGTHSATVGVYHKNIKIYRNTFENIDDCAIVMMNYKDSVAENNVIKNAEAGVYFVYSKSDFKSFFHPTTLKSNIDPVSRCIIRNNTIELRDCYTSVGIRTYGMIKKESNKKIMLNDGMPYADFSVSDIDINNNVIRNAKLDGIGLVGTVKSKVYNNKIYYAKDNKIKAAEAGGKGLYLKSSSSNVLNNNVVNNTAGCNNLKHGLIIYEESTANTIKSNTFIGTRYYGISVKDNATAIIEDNVIDDVAKDGIKIIGKSKVDLNKNIIRNTSGNGISYTEESKASYIKNNTIQNIKGYGIYGSISSNITDITSNNIAYVTKDGIHINKSNISNINNNVISKIGSDAICIYNNAKVKSICKNTVNVSNDNGIYIQYGIVTDVKSNKLASVVDNAIFVDYKANVKNIVSNTITKSGKVGIYINNKSKVSYIKNNKITSTKLNGVYVRLSTCTELSKNNISSCKVSYMYKSKITSIKNNNISKSASHGLYIKDSTITNVISNKLYSNKSNGLYINNSKVKNLNSNACTSNKKTGIYMNKASITNVIKNNCNSNKQDGIYTYKTKISKCNANIVKSNKRNGIYINSKSNVKYLYSNNVKKSNKKAIFIVKSTVKKIKSNSGKVVKIV